jgi:signal transduction histidine kinase
MNDDQKDQINAKQKELFDLHVLSNFIHQIINPLNGVIGTVDNLIDGTIQEDRRDQRLRAVRAQLEWAVVLVRNLAFFTKTALSPGGSPDPDLSRTCVIPQVIIEAIQFFQEAGVSRGIRIELTDRQTQYAVKGSPDLLRQVFMNLMDNAVKYSDKGSTIEIKLRVQKKTDDLLVEVKNVGIGFSAEESSRLFEEGFRGEQAKNTVASGTGLGLYICKVIIERIHGGRISAEYSPEKRLVEFRIRFPNWSQT